MAVVINKFKTAGVESKRYFYFLVRFAKDSMLRDKRRVAFSVILGVSGVFLRALSIALTLGYAQSFGSGEAVLIPIIGVEIQRSPQSLISACIVVFLLLFTAGSFIYLSRFISLRIATDYGAYCSKTALVDFSYSQRFISSFEGNSISEAEVNKIIGSGSRIACRMLLVLLASVIPICSTVIFGVFLFYINPLVSGIVIVVLLISILPYYYVSRRGAKASMLMEAHGGQAKREQQSLLRSYANSNLPSLSTRNSLAEIYSGGMLALYRDEFRQRLLTVDYAKLVNSFVMGVILFVVIAFIGMQALETNSGWEKLIVYLLSLKLFLSAIQEVLRRIASISRFYPIINRQFIFRDNCHAASRSREDSEHAEEFAIQVKSKIVDSSLESGVLRASETILVLSPHSLDRYAISLIADSLNNGNKTLGNEILSNMFFVSAATWPADHTLRTALSLKQNACNEEYLSAIPDDASRDEIYAAFGCDFHNRIDKEEWERLTDYAKSLFYLCVAKRVEARWIVLSPALLTPIPEEKIVFLLNWLKQDRFLLLVSDSVSICEHDYSVEWEVLLGDKVVYGLGRKGWLKDCKHETSMLIERTKKLISNRWLGPDFGLDSDDDMDI